MMCIMGTRHFTIFPTEALTWKEWYIDLVPLKNPTFYNGPSAFFNSRLQKANWTVFAIDVYY